MHRINPFSIFLFVVLSSGYQLLMSQNLQEVGGMIVDWTFAGDQIQFELVAPDDGWVGLGFNSQNDIVGTHLFLFSQDGETQRHSELVVKGVGNPVPVEKLYGKEAALDFPFTVKEEGGKTYVSFSLQAKAYPQYRTALKEGTELWLICAFSESDDFDHHSRMRKHIRVKL